MACYALCPPCHPTCYIKSQRHRSVRCLGPDSLSAGTEGHQGSHITPALVPSPRRSANYQSTSWNDSLIQSLTNDYMGRAHIAKLEELKGQVRHLLGEAVGVAAELELVDVLQRLGVAYHFEQEIESILRTMYTNLEANREALDDDLLHTALLFRLLRKHGLAVPQGDRDTNSSSSLAHGLLQCFAYLFYRDLLA
uniref:Myrcene synthase, chloroplastic n=1 Tax=Anthurium amnicola TaxID=1678845 RepID=A0A1D1XTX0_9ARAE